MTVPMLTQLCYKV